MGVDFGVYEQYNEPKTFWQRKFAFLPHQCQNTGKCIWMKWAYQSILKDGFNDIHTSWVTEEQFMLMILKGL